MSLIEYSGITLVSSSVRPISSMHKISSYNLKSYREGMTCCISHELSSNLENIKGRKLDVVLMQNSALFSLHYFAYALLAIFC